jgi:hypothetical protein
VVMQIKQTPGKTIKQQQTKTQQQQQQQQQQ